MQVAIEERGKVTVVTVEGSLDALTAPDLGQALNDLIESGSTNLVADMAGVSYSSSSGIRVLLSAVKQTRQNQGDLRLAAVQKEVAKVLKLAGLMDTIHQYADVEAAVASYVGSN